MEIFKILNSVYSKARIKISHSNKFSEKIKVNIRVLQGEILLPLLFALFLYDLEEFFIKKGVQGVAYILVIPINGFGYLNGKFLKTFF